MTSLAPLDREKSSHRYLPLIVRDAKGLSSTATITVIIADKNDNPMEPGTKSVTVTRVKVSRNYLLSNVFYMTYHDLYIKQ